jgi:hypothetical protein
MSSAKAGIHRMVKSSRRDSVLRSAEKICSTVSNCDQTARCLFGILGTVDEWKSSRMSLGKLVTKTTRMAPATPMRETFIARKMLAVCCVCRLIRCETGPFPGRERWVTPRTYRTTHGVNPVDSPLTHTYCPKCFTKAQETMTQYFRKVGTSA